MDGIDTLRATPEPGSPDQYGTEVLCAGWTPGLRAVAGLGVGVCQGVSEPTLPEVETFLSRFYQAQRP